jgi:hypothetical protein
MIFEEDGMTGSPRNRNCWHPDGSAPEFKYKRTCPNARRAEDGGAGDAVRAILLANKNLPPLEKAIYFVRCSEEVEHLNSIGFRQVGTVQSAGTIFLRLFWSIDSRIP